MGTEGGGMGRVHLDETSEGQEAIEGIVSLKAGQHNREIAIEQRQSKSIPGSRHVGVHQPILEKDQSRINASRLIEAIEHVARSFIDAHYADVRAGPQ